MLRRILCAIAVTATLLSLSACGLRADLGSIPEGEIQDHVISTTTAAPKPTLPPMDEMAKYAWEIYETALKKEREFREFDLFYESVERTAAETATATARFQKVPDGVDTHEYFMASMQYGDEVLGYYKGGVGYFSVSGKKYWLFLNEEEFLEELGFRESITLTAEMFAQAMVAENENGTKTVSCPLAEPYAGEYAKIALDENATAATVTLNVTVGADGAPKEYVTKISATVPLYGVVELTETNRYEKAGAGVEITPPADLDSYQEYAE